MFPKKYIIALLVVAGMALVIGMQTFGQSSTETPWKPQNLKVLPKNISHDELIKIMRGYATSLGVRCGECHAMSANSTPDKPELDFVSDAKPEKNTAREMMRMVSTINKKYISKAGDGKFEEVACVTCHMGKLKPMVSIDSLPKKENH